MPILKPAGGRAECAQAKGWPLLRTAKGKGTNSKREVEVGTIKNRGQYQPLLSGCKEVKGSGS